MQHGNVNTHLYNINTLGIDSIIASKMTML